MDSTSDQTSSPEKNENSSPVSTNDNKNKSSSEVPNDIKTTPETLNEASDEDTGSNEDFLEFDLSAIEIASNVLEEMEKSLKPTEAYDNLLGACSSTAQALKQTISDVLKSREKVVISAGDSTSELEATLSEKIADFENVVSGCFVPKDPKHDLTNIKHPAFSNVIITEVDDTPEEASPCSSDSTKEVVVETAKQVEEEKSSLNLAKQVVEEKSSSNVTTTTASEINTDSQTLHKTEAKDVGDKDSSITSTKKKSDKENKSTKAPQVQPETIPAPVPNLPVEDKSSKKQQKSNSNKKKGEKTVDQILKSLSSCSTTEEKLQVLCKKHAETVDEYKLLEPRLKQLERQVVSQQKEKEQLQAEHNRMILAKSRLESLCRELQRQNKAIKEENLSRLKEEEEKRKEIANKFQGTLNDISTLMQDHSKKNLQLKEENSELAKKLKTLVDHYDMWEKHMEKVVQQSNLEAQLAKAKLAKMNLLHKQETEKFLKEKQSLLENMSELQKKCNMLSTNELRLRTELGDYTSKYEEFQTVINKSSEVFASFKTDMEVTSKKIKKLEKETNTYKLKFESSQNALLSMISDKEKRDKDLTNAQQRIATLEKLCRALQAERNELQNQLNTVAGATNSTKKDVPPPSAETPVA